MTSYFSEKFLDGLIKVAKQVDDENQANFKKLEDALKTAQTQYDKVVQQNKDLQSERNIYLNALKKISEQVESINVVTVDGINKTITAVEKIKLTLKEVL